MILNFIQSFFVHLITRSALSFECLNDAVGHHYRPTGYVKNSNNSEKNEIISVPGFCGMFSNIMLVILNLALMVQILHLITPNVSKKNIYMGLLHWKKTPI